jgi:DNA (cytosine-5)-methyltransferase 1
MAAYYNEIDPKAAAWLRELIKQGHIADGIVDERSIIDVTPNELRDFTQCHFFAGIGVWSYALRSAGWADDRPVWTGSCPCQPFSAAGARGGFDDERHLWPHWHHLISQCRPPVVFGEQVASKDGLGWLDLVCADMEATGYAIGAADLCAAGIGAPHIRQRLWFVGLADAGCSRGIRRPDASGFDGAETRQRNEGSADDQPRGSNGGLADTDRDGCGAGDTIRPNGKECDAEHGGSKIGLADTAGARLEGGGGSLLQGGDYGYVSDRRDGGLVDTGRPGPTNGFWRDADWLFCRDGKWRPVEPSTSPLAHGAAARVGRLRGYGNAIVGPVAQIFIEETMNIINDQPPIGV